ncbi:hypothetical protein NDU88_006457 [Pleurodeles waltl]|uniref:Uncharacterized protein n=1 Tax=Pleurodeles waltl TaxID=8319 RepID=A0AAV7SPP3_PLEWA|nr:hypothetical protein NDU88_006457 [Pleurodeles waltl]
MLWRTLSSEKAVAACTTKLIGVRQDKPDLQGQAGVYEPRTQHEQEREHRWNSSTSTCLSVKLSSGDLPGQANNRRPYALLELLPGFPPYTPALRVRMQRKPRVMWPFVTNDVSQMRFALKSEENSTCAFFSGAAALQARHDGRCSSRITE